MSLPFPNRGTADAERAGRILLVVSASLYTAFLVYGSLLPLRLRLPAGSPLEAFLAGVGPVSPSLTDLATNVLIFVPLSFLWAAAAAPRGRPPGLAALAAIVAASGLVSAAIEFLQVFAPPRVSSRTDLAANLAGALAGALAAAIAAPRALRAVESMLESHGQRAPPLPGLHRAALALLWLAAAAALAGWLTGQWIGAAALPARLDAMRWWPLVAYQQAAMHTALLSAAATTAVYGPLGWMAWRMGSGKRPPLAGAALAGVAGAAFALLFEGGKLILAGRSPDTGNIVIAFLATALGFLAAPMAWPAAVASRILTPSVPVADRRASTLPPSRATFATRIASRAGAVLAALGAGWLVATFPVAPGLLAAGAVLYALLQWRVPWSWLVALPAALPVMDFAPWTGRFFFDEFDLLVLATVAAGWWRLADSPPRWTLSRGATLALALFAVSVTVSLLIGLFPLAPVDANSFGSYYSRYNALRVGKGFVLAFALLPLLLWTRQQHPDAPRRFAAGMALGLTAACASVLWERYAFAGLLDFSHEFRVSGLFSTMHTGGAHLDAFLAASVPFAVYQLLTASSRATRLVAGALVAAGAYALMVTFARASFAALGIGLAGSAVAAIAAQRAGAGPARAAAALAVIGLALAVAVPVLTGSFARSRLAQAGADLTVRSAHWSEASDMMDTGFAVQAFGMGLGRYPETYLYRSREGNLPAQFRIERESSGAFLRIGSGRPTYLDQIVPVQPGRTYEVALRLRTRSEGARLNVLLCERTFFHGAGCESVTFGPVAADGEWHEVRAPLASGRLGGSAGLAWRPVKLSLENASPGAALDIDALVLRDATGRNLVTNGDFSDGHDRWFISSTFNHLPWHAKNLAVQLHFEQGWLGVGAFGALVLFAIARTARAGLAGSTWSGALLASLAALLTVGVFDSLFDAPRITLLTLLLMCAALGWPAGGAPTALRAAPAAVRRPTGRAAPWQREAAPAKGVLLAGAASVLVTSVAVLVATRAPFMPYNLRELPNPHHPALAVLALAVFTHWIFGVPAAIAGWLSRASTSALALPVVVLAHGILAWAQLHFAVLPESIHDIAGTQELGWPGEWELMGRVAAFFAALTLPFTGAALVVRTITGGRPRPLGAILVWAITASLLFPLLYWVVVTQATTDNIVELIAHQASPGSTALIAAYLLVVGMAGSLLAATAAGASARGVWIGAAAVALSLPLGYLLLHLGTEQAIAKDRSVFSALQFLLSKDREHYATGLQLWLRFAIAHAGAVVALAWTQYPAWAWLRLRDGR